MFIVEGKDEVILFYDFCDVFCDIILWDIW